LHLFLIIIAILVTFNSFNVREIRAEEFGKKSIISSLLKSNQTDMQETVEETNFQDNNDFQKADYNIKTAVISRSSLLNENTLEEDPQLATSESGRAVVSTKITTSISNTLKQDIQYYIVELGDTVSLIAEKFNVSTDTILWENKLGPRDYIKPGDRLTILPTSGVSHQIQKGDTLEKIAKKYGADQDEIIEYNKLASAEAIDVDQIILIPGGEEPAPPPTQISSGSAYASSKIPASAKVPAGSRLLWPTTGRKINQYYTWRHHGIDIGGNYSSPIYAANSGRVESTGWGTGYGNRIIVNHGGGQKTLYAHLSKFFVSTGDSVEKGQTIGMMGCTGWCTGTHLHFEVIINGSKVNPLSYL